MRRFGNIYHHSSSDEYHQRLIAATIQKPPSDWIESGRPSHTWLRAMEADLKPLNIEWRRKEEKEGGGGGEKEQEQDEVDKRKQ